MLCLMLFGCNGAHSGGIHKQNNSEPKKQGHYTQRQPGLHMYNQVPHNQIGRQMFPTGRPYTFSEFKERYKIVGTTPEGAVRMYFDAVYSYIDKSRHQEGVKMLRYSLHEGKNWESSAAWNTFVSRLKDPAYHYIFHSFAQGTTVLNNYAMDPDRYQLMFVKARQETDYVQVLIRSSGADSPRPVHVRQFEDGLWYIVNNHGTYAEVRSPAKYKQKNTTTHDADFD